jgi:hypothetical protein
MGSPHSLGPWSVIQAALHGGAGTSRPAAPAAAYAFLAAPAWASLATAGTVKVVVTTSASKDAAERLIFIITGSNSITSGRARSLLAP